MIPVSKYNIIVNCRGSNITVKMKLKHVCQFAMKPVAL